MEKIKLIQPLDNPVISQLFGKDFKWHNPASGDTQPLKYEWFYKDTYKLLGHPGIDYACEIGTPVKAAHDGVILYAGNDTINGNLVQVWNEKQNYKTLYGHNSAFKVKQGDLVKAGQVIALSGNTGSGTGPHLHFGFKYTIEGGNTKDLNNGYNGCIDPIQFFVNENINHKTMTFKKVKEEPHVWMCDEENKNRMMIVDMATLFILNGGKFEEVPTLVDYKVSGTLVWTERVIN